MPRAPGFTLHLGLFLVLFLAGACCAPRLWAQDDAAPDRDPGAPAIQPHAIPNRHQHVDDRDQPSQPVRHVFPQTVSATEAAFVSDQDEDQAAAFSQQALQAAAPAETLDDGRGDQSPQTQPANRRAVPTEALNDGRGDRQAAARPIERRGASEEVLDNGRGDARPEQPPPSDPEDLTPDPPDGTDAEVEVPDGLTLRPNYPNPFNPQTEIAFTVPTEGRAVLRVYDVSGRLVDTLFDGVAQPDRYYRVTFDGRRLASGLYVYTLDAGGYGLERTMLLVK